MKPPIDIDEVLTKCADLLAEVESVLSTSSLVEADEGRNVRVMPRRRAAAIFPVALLCEQVGLDRIGTVTTEDMVRMKEKVSFVRSLALRAEFVAADLAWMRRQVDRRCASYLTAFYGALRVAARDDESIGERLAPIEAALRRPKKPVRKRRRLRGPSSR